MKHQRSSLKLICVLVLLTLLVPNWFGVSQTIPDDTDTGALLTPSGVPLGQNFDEDQDSLTSEIISDVSANSGNISVLIDKGHDNYYPYYGFINSLIYSGYNVVEYPVPFITLDVLVRYDVYIVPLITKPFTTEEVSAIYEFVMGGGNLFVIADHSSTYSNPVQALVNKFGVSLHANQVTDSTDCLDGNSTLITYSNENFSNHAIMENIALLQSYTSSSLSPGLATTLIFTDSDATPANSTVAAALENEKGGRVVVVGDGNYFDDEDGLNVGDNKQFGINIIDWLTEPRIIGTITSPTDGYTTGPASIQINATAEYPDGPGIERVEFYARWDGVWQPIGDDASAPYSVIWVTPNDIQSQKIYFRIDILGLDGLLEKYASNVVSINLIKSFENPVISENWITNRAYLNQRSLNPPTGDVMCSAASMAMVLAMEGVIPYEYPELSAKAIEMYPKVLINGTAYVGLMASVLRDEGTSSLYYGPMSNDDGWIKIKELIDNNHPLIVRTSSMTTFGHLIVAVGYQKDGDTRNIIVYDPWGEWKGVVCSELGDDCPNNYNKNYVSSTSTVGRWVYYDFDKIFGEYLIVAPNTQLRSFVNLTEELNPPDSISDEPRITGSYEGVPIIVDTFYWLPIILN